MILTEGCCCEGGMLEAEEPTAPGAEAAAKPREGASGAEKARPDDAQAAEPVTS